MTPNTQSPIIYLRETSRNANQENRIAPVGGDASLAQIGAARQFDFFLSSAPHAPMRASGEVARGNRRSVCARTCEWCGCVFVATSYKVAVGRARFCGRPCARRAAALRIPADARRGEQNGNFKGWASRNKRAYVDRYRAKYPEKAAANDAVQRAIRAGRLVRASACDTCGATPTNEALHGHHDDYAQPLVVRWLCRACHRAWHSGNACGIGAGLLEGRW